MASEARSVVSLVIGFKADEQQETRVGLLLSDLILEAEELVALGREVHARETSLALDGVLAGSIYDSREDFAVHGVVREVAGPVNVYVDSISVLKVL